MSSYHPVHCYHSLFFSLHNCFYWHLKLRQIFHVLTEKKCSDGYQHVLFFNVFFNHHKCSIQNTVFLLWLHFFLSLSVVASSPLVSAGFLIHFLLLLCLKIYDVFIPYHVLIPVIWLFLSAYLNSDKIMQLSSQELLFWKCLDLIIFSFTIGQTKNNTKISDLFKGQKSYKPWICQSISVTSRSRNPTSVGLPTQGCGPTSVSNKDIMIHKISA